LRRVATAVAARPGGLQPRRFARPNNRQRPGRWRSRTRRPTVRPPSYCRPSTRRSAGPFGHRLASVPQPGSDPPFQYFGIICKTTKHCVIINLFFK